MNFPGLGIGMDFGLNPQPLQKRTKERFRDKPFGIMLQGFGNQRTAAAEGVWPEEKRLVIGTNVGFIKRVSRLNGIGVGAELYYDGINAVYQQRTGQALQTTVGAVSIQHYLFLGKLLFGQQMAWYVTPNTGSQQKIFERYFIEYEVKKNWYAGFTLKATGDQSDYMGFSAGYFLRI